MGGVAPQGYIDAQRRRWLVAWKQGALAIAPRMREVRLDLKVGEEHLIDIDQIRVRDGRRALQEDAVASIRESIETDRLQQPLLITPDIELVDGLHRMEACKLLGWQRVPCKVVSNARAAILELAMNLARAQMDRLERAEGMARLKELYESEHPESRAGVAGGLASGRARSEGTDAPCASVPSFTGDMAEKVGISRRAVQEDVQIASIKREVRDRLRGTPVANESKKLLKIAQTPVEQQEGVARSMIEGRRTKESHLRVVAAEKDTADGGKEEGHDTTPGGRKTRLQFDNALAAVARAVEALDAVRGKDSRRIYCRTWGAAGSRRRVAGLERQIEILQAWLDQAREALAKTQPDPTADDYKVDGQQMHYKARLGKAAPTAEKLG